MAVSKITSPISPNEQANKINEIIDEIPAEQVQANWNETSTSSKAYIQNKPTIPSVGNGTLTIQKNGSTLKTFTANSSSNVTANITVPTKTSELTNDSGYTTNTGTVTSVNNVAPVNGNVSLTIPSVGNGTITITQGGTTKGSFTTNQSGNATIALDAGGGTATTVKINGTSITSSGVADIKTNGTYNASTNKIATMSDVPSAVTETTVSGWGFTKNAGTITGITMNGSSKGTSGVVDLGTVITSHQDISGKANTDLSNLVSTSSTNFDGSPTFKYVQLLDGKANATNTSTNLKSTGYLPNDNYRYAVFVCNNLRSTNDMAASIGSIASPLDNSISGFICKTRSNSNSKFSYNGCWIPLDTNGIIHYQTNGTASTGITFELLGYRRIGTNT